MTSSIQDILDMLQNADSAELTRLINSRLQVMSRNSEEIQVLPIKKSYKSFISPKAKCFSNPNQKGILFDDFSVYKDCLEFMKKESGGKIQNDTVLDNVLEFVDIYFGSISDYKKGDYLFDEKQYNDFTANRVVSIEEMKGKKIASDFERTILSYNLLKFFGVKVELIFNNERNFIVADYGGLPVITCPGHFVYFVLDGDNYFRATATDEFPDYDTYEQWYNGNKDFNFTGNYIKKSIKQANRTIKEFHMPSITCEGLNLSSESIYRF